MSSWWVSPEGDSLVQGEFIKGCRIPRIEFIPSEDGMDDNEVELVTSNCIILTQTCDIEQSKVEDILLCSCYTVEEMTKTFSHFNDPKLRERIRRGELPAYCMLKSPFSESETEKSLIVDFKSVASLSINFLMDHINKNKLERLSLTSPYTEHLSQAFAKFFMRVALPVQIQSFK